MQNFGNGALPSPAILSMLPALFASPDPAVIVFVAVAETFFVKCLDPPTRAISDSDCQALMLL